MNKKEHIHRNGGRHMWFIPVSYTHLVGGLLTDIGTEELAHMEIICAMVYQLTKHLSIEEAKAAGFDAYYIDHTTALWPQAAAGLPFTAIEFQSKGCLLYTSRCV